ncbi:MAG: 4Fe-4S dicluster domain-containing protein [Anaerolineae bacterium]|nr:4Fe-4S dicluster domain-containing protein [Anaerolineae bacterium]
MSKAMLIDTTRCTACRGCQVACKQWNDLPAEKTRNLGSYQNPYRLSAYTWTIIQMREVEYEGRLFWSFLKRQCMHCLHPACVSACPVGAMHKLPDGPVLYNDARCIGCRYCMTACPFRIPRFEWDKPVGYIRKCHFCFDRLAEGLMPACVKTCPTGALQFGEREEMIALAEQRLKAQPERYIQHVYGKEEGGGTSVLILSAVPFAYLGLPTLADHPVPSEQELAVPFEYLGVPSLGKEPVAKLNDDLARYGTPGIAIGVAAILAGLQWYSKRRGTGQHTGDAAAAAKESGS